MSVRSDFYDGVTILRNLAEEQLFTDVFPPTDFHNHRARILRNGLVISAFSMLETYLEERLEENILLLPRALLPYSALGDDLRRFLSLDAILGLGNRIGFEDKNDKLSFAERGLLRLSSGGAIGYTGFGFSPKGSNVSADDLSVLLKAFGITNAWNFLSDVCSKLGFRPVSFIDDFRNLSRARNKAAHDSNSNIATSDLQAYLNTVVLVGMSTDLVVTNAVKSFVTQINIAGAINAANTYPSSFRFIDEVNNEWVERINVSGRAIKKYPDKVSARAKAKTRISKASIIIRNASLIPIELVE